MNLLEAFHFIFEADASNLEEGLSDAERENRRLRQGITDTDAVAENLGQTFLDLTKSFVGLLGGVLAVGALKTMAITSAEATDALDKQAKQLNVNTGALFDWQNAVVASGGTAEGFNATLAELNKKTRDPERALMRLADRFKGLSQYRAMRLGEALGIDAGTAEALRKGSVGLQNLIDRQRELGTVTQEQVDVANAFNDQMRDTDRVFDDVRRRVATALLPAMTKWLEVVEKTVRFLRDNKAFTIAFFAAVAGIITAVYLPAILSAVAATYALIAPYLLIGAAVAAVAAVIALLADDIYAFLNGQDSMIGEIAKKWPIVGDIVRGLAEVFVQFWQLLKDLGGFLLTLFTDPAAAWQEFKDYLSKGVAELSEKFPALAVIARMIGAAFRAAGQVTMDVWDRVSKFISTVLEVFKKGIALLIDLMPAWLKEKLGITMEVDVNAPKDAPGSGGGGDPNAVEPPAQMTPQGRERMQQLVNTAVMDVEAMSKSPMNAQSSNAIAAGSRTSNKRTDIRVDKIEVITQATDADGIANSIDGSMQNQFANTTNLYDDGFQA